MKRTVRKLTRKRFERQTLKENLAALGMSWGPAKKMYAGTITGPDGRVIGEMTAHECSAWLLENFVRN